MDKVAEMTGFIWAMFAAWLIIGIWLGTKLEAYRWRRSEEEGKHILSGETFYKVTKNRTPIT